MTFEDIRNRGLLLFEYVRGSQLYNTNLKDGSADIDTGGVYIMDNNFDFDFEDEISDEKNDNKWWELGKFMKLAMDSNPAVLEAFFVPDDKILYEHPLFKEHIRSKGSKFLTKKCFKPFGEYAASQVKKARGQEKKIHWDMENMKRKTPLDFCFTFDGRQGSINIQDWLERNGLRQDCCGLTNLTNMKDCYLMYYDFAQHLRLTNSDMADEINKQTSFGKFAVSHFMDRFRKQTEYGVIVDYVVKMTEKPFGGHCGIINNEGTSNTVRLCSTQKEEEPICMMTYNADGYGTHCRKYKEYEEWKKNRNKARYESNMVAEKQEDPEYKYDVKNMYHCFRNVAMCIEIAQGKGLLLDRTNIDRDFLLDVRRRKFKYSELDSHLSDMVKRMETECKNSTISDSVDENWVKNITKYFRNIFFKKKRVENIEKSKNNFYDSQKRNADFMLKNLTFFIQRFKISPENVMVTGSIALLKQGLLPVGRFIHDIDIVIKGDKELENKLSVFTEMYGGTEKLKFSQEPEKKIPNVKHKPYVFPYNNIEFNIWIQEPDSEFDSELKCSEGFHIANVKHIFDAKKSYGRLKDVNDLIETTNIIIGDSNSYKKRFDENGTY